MHRRYAETFEALNIKINIDDFSYYKKIKITNHNYAFSSNDKLIGIALCQTSVQGIFIK